MNNDRIEEQLRRQPVRLPPAEWREDILRAARAHPPVQSSRASMPWWREWLWPSPVAWAGAALVWGAALILHLNTPRLPFVVAATTPASAGIVHMTFAEQRAWLDQMLQPPSAPPPGSRFVPRPRSERFRQTRNA